uniref:Uncharacterized protein n=1 Tax=Arundo donax TaxID=35708 RepID=A0A0A8Z199_ARUDO
MPQVKLHLKNVQHVAILLHFDATVFKCWWDSD